MGINLTKGQKISLEKEAPGLAKIIMGLGWDVNNTSSSSVDLDASCLMINADNKLVSLIYFGAKKSPDGSIVHSGDNLTGAGEGDDEQIMVDLSKVPDNVKKLIFTVNIFDAAKRKQHFGMVSNAFVRLVNAANNQEVARFNLSESYPDMTGMVMGEVYKHNNEWKMSAVGEGSVVASVSEFANKYK